MKRTIASIPILLLAAVPHLGQNEQRLKQFFEGKSVIVKIDMPGTSKGVNIDTGRERVLNLDDYSRSLRDNGVAIRKGESVVVTKIKIKDDHIEFQLGAGGYSGYGDTVSDYVAPVSKTEREKNLEKDLKTVTDPQQKRRMKEEVDRLKRERERDDARNRLISRANADRERESLRYKRLNGGSRFNIEFIKGTPVERLTPSWISDALGDYVEIPGEHSTIANKPSGSRLNAPSASAGGGAGVMNRISRLRKGMTQQEVESLLGRPKTRTPRLEGKLRTLTCRFEPDENHAVDSVFVDGVLVRFTIYVQ